MAGLKIGTDWKITNSNIMKQDGKETNHAGLRALIWISEDYFSQERNKKGYLTQPDFTILK